MIDTTKGGVILTLFLIGLAASISGGVQDIYVGDVIEPTCKDGIDNDADGTPVAREDFWDWECQYMPFDLVTNTNSVGEFHIGGSITPAYIANYVTFVEKTPYNYPTYFEFLEWKINVFQGPPETQICNPNHQQVLTDYRDVYGMSDAKSGIVDYQNYCGVSF